MKAESLRPSCRKNSAKNVSRSGSHACSGRILMLFVKYWRDLGKRDTHWRCITMPLRWLNACLCKMLNICWIQCGHVGEDVVNSQKSFIIDCVPHRVVRFDGDERCAYLQPAIWVCDIANMLVFCRSRSMILHEFKSFRFSHGSE